MIHERFYCNRRYAAATCLPPASCGRLGVLVAQSVNILFQVRLGRSGLRAPVSRGVLAVSSRTVMNDVG